MERLSAMLEKQGVYYDLRSKALVEPSPSPLLKWRSHMLEWYFEVIDHTEHDRSVAALAVNLLDRYAAAKSAGGSGALNQREYSLAAMTSLTLASKLYLSRHNRRSHISISYVLRLAHGSYTETDVEATERDMLAALNWLVHPPIAPEFIEHLFHLLPRWENDRNVRLQIFEHARYAAELALVSCLPHEPGRMAYACILSGFKDIPRNIRNAFVRNVANVMGMTPDVVTSERDCVVHLIRNVLQQA
jgi:tRNA isopentenyl-2-thiomethyl-A-37 hydroxylase MiaE